MMPNFIATLQACQGQYIALCEGDDYWTDPYKLQKQVEFLEKNPDYSLVHSDVLCLQKDDQLSINKFFKQWLYKKQDYDLRMSIFTPLAFTCTTVFRNNIELNQISPKIQSGDWMLFVLLGLQGRAHFFKEPMAVYRMGVGVSQYIQFHEDFLYRSVFLIRLISLKNEMLKNVWLIRGVFFYILQYIGFKNKGPYFLFKIASLLRYQVK
jgi:glycosyltransferase involved in cell wall biosynthesis